MIEISNFDIIDMEPFLRNIFVINDSNDQPYSDNFGLLGYSSKTMLVNFGQNSFLIAIYPLLYLIDYLLFKIKSNLRWFRRARRTLRANLYWNLLFRSAFEFSLILMIILTIDIAACNFTEFSFGFSFVLSATLLVLLTAVPLFIRFYILKKYNLLRTNYITRRYSDIFEGLQLKNNPNSLIIMEYFMWRRLIYGLCMVLLEGKLYIQF